MDRSRVVLAEILRPRGNRGEVLVRSLTDVAGRLEALQQAQVTLADGSERTVALTEAWPHKGEWVLKFAGVDSISDAEVFSGADLWVPVEERAVLTDGDFYQSDLIGCLVFDRGTKRALGVVEGWQQYGGPPLMEVTVDGKDVLIPFVSSECEIDLGAREIRMTLPEGLLEL